MEDENKELHQCMERMIWDFLDIHGFMSGRKAEVTLLAALTIFLVARKRHQMKDIASVFNVSNSTVTDYVDYLEKKGYVARVRSQEDRREVYIELTGKGQEWVDKNKKINSDYWNQRMGRLTPEERQQFISLICKLMGIGEQPISQHAVIGK